MAQKKSFKNNPALQFISKPEEQSQPPIVADVAAELPREPETVSKPDEPVTVSQYPMKKNPLYIETKSKRLQLLLQPSLYNKIKDTAAARGVSVNELVHSLLEECVNKEPQGA